eukprot:CAMPEP_0195517628 /NCGR_PEP_ID=MMETSP0794_2-20130614/11100_1 /TAXON_ID=515487 /ORGANISM="Stephanopyxis turris, Strain CCMP 815" /LENGTH=59 /DNA_ID=CAMNT_0040646459 /DNA_START=69 /DNA_END=248 /DNA_ORIENTATION=+
MNIAIRDRSFPTKRSTIAALGLERPFPSLPKTSYRDSGGIVLSKEKDQMSKYALMSQVS